jgi:hypothetical protein
MAGAKATHVPESVSDCAPSKTRGQITISTGVTTPEKIASSSAARTRAESFANPSHCLSIRTYKTEVFTSREIHGMFQNFL